MKKSFLRFVCRNRLVTTLVAWRQLKSFLSFASQSGWQAPKGQNALPRRSRPGALAIDAAFAQPVRLAFEWHPLRLLRYLWCGAGAIRRADRYCYLFGERPANQPSPLNRMKRITQREARKWQNTIYKIRRPSSSVAEISS